MILLELKWKWFWDACELEIYNFFSCNFFRDKKKASCCLFHMQTKKEKKIITSEGKLEAKLGCIWQWYLRSGQVSMKHWAHAHVCYISLMGGFHSSLRFSSSCSPLRMLSTACIVYFFAWSVLVQAPLRCMPCLPFVPRCIWMASMNVSLCTKWYVKR